MEFEIVIVLAVGTLFFAEPAQTDNEPNRQSLQGVWQLAGGEVEANVLTQAEVEDGELVIDGDHFTFTMGKSDPVMGTQTLGTLNDLQYIDITDESGDRKGKTCLGIYEVLGDEFRVVFAPPGEDRPLEFKTAPGSGQWMHVWKRVKE